MLIGQVNIPPLIIPRLNPCPTVGIPLGNILSSLISIVLCTQDEVTPIEFTVLTLTIISPTNPTFFTLKLVVFLLAIVSLINLSCVSDLGNL